MKKSKFGLSVLMVAGAFCVAIAGSGLALAESEPGMSSKPAGIGEKGTGQSQSSMERAGETQSRVSQGQPSVPAGIGEKGTGQTQSTLERSGGTQSKNVQGQGSEPAAIGEKGTGQTQSSMERSGQSFR